MTACAHGMPSAASCVDCMYDTGVGPAPAEPVTVDIYARARHNSQCPACDFPIAAGQHIARLSTGQWVHAGCTP